MLLIPLQNVKLGPAQPAHLWALAFLGILVLHKEIRATAWELFVYALFMAVALVNTRYGGFEHIKAGEQIMKFGLIYPAFYLVGRAYGEQGDGRLPVGLKYLFVFVAVQFAVEWFKPPVLYRTTNFAVGAMHGTFLERGWLANYVLLVAYLWYLRTDRALRATVAFLAVNILLALLTQSKSTLVQCGLLLLFTMRAPIGLKISLVIAGGFAYWAYFSAQLTGDMLRVRLEEERGLAMAETVRVLARDGWGHGFGFVESYFSRLWFSVRGLGLGANSIFCAPVDLAVIAGFAGVLFWAVFFGGLGLSSLRYMTPIAAGSIINPFHQGELIYLFAGLLIAYGLREARAKRGAVSSKQESPPILSRPT
ncbi:hypothetical protein [Niveibacterium sp. SC-1]|uniref:hypothetical protein n=1 Tax=Niveibacterium sp. SC-1 TaxID=3135646 RepID=UPI00311EDF90